MSDETKTPRHVASIASRLEGSGYITSAQYADLEYAAIQDCNRAVADLEARHADEIKQARREAYEDAGQRAVALGDVAESIEARGLMFAMLVYCQEKAGKL